MTKYRNEEVIKELIVKAHRAGLCDKEGNSLDINGHMVAMPSKTGSCKTYVLRNNKLVLKGKEFAKLNFPERMVSNRP